MIKFILAYLYEHMYYLRHRNKRLGNFSIYKNAIINKSGVEIGGPSRVFKKKLPIYYFAKNIDGINFAVTTLWERDLKDHGPYKYFMQRVGVQFIREATDLFEIQDSKYDFLTSSHCLEHVANPLKALREWNRVTKKNGYLILVLPNKAGNFDKNRKVTKFKHILKDFNRDVKESDMTHFKEISKFHEFSMDKNSGSYDEFITRGKNNLKIRGLHHHVFDKKLIKEMLEWSDYILLDFKTDSCNFFTLAMKI